MGISLLCKGSAALLLCWGFLGCLTSCFFYFLAPEKECSPQRKVQEDRVICCTNKVLYNDLGDLCLRACKVVESYDLDLWSAPCLSCGILFTWFVLLAVSPGAPINMLSLLSTRILATVAVCQAYVLTLVFFSMWTNSVNNQNGGRAPEWENILTNATNAALSRVIGNTPNAGTSKVEVRLSNTVPVAKDKHIPEDFGKVKDSPRAVEDSEADRIAKKVDDKLSVAPPFHGWQKKASMLEPDKWLLSLRKQREAQSMEWLKQPLSTRKKKGEFQPPAQAPGCLVNINYHYKFIWIKGKKVGGSSLRANVGNVCGDWYKTGGKVNMTYCTTSLWKEKEVDVEEIQKLWKEYVVFSFARNPYTRFASSYKYIDGFLKGRCERPTFNQVCKNTFLQADSVRKSNCGPEYTMWHHLHHMMEQSSCLFTRDGKPVVDFLGRTEHLTEDYQTIAREVNRRLGDSNLKLNETKPVGIVNSTSKKSKSEAAYLFEDYPECLARVEEAFAMDFESLGYKDGGKVIGSKQEEKVAPKET